MKFAICNEMFAGWDFDRVCGFIAECGYDGVEIAPFTFNDDPGMISENEATRIGDTARAAGLELTGMHWLLAQPTGLHITTPDDAVRQRSIKHAQHLSRLCATMGGRIMVWGSPKQRDVVEGDTHERAFDRAADAIRQVCAVAGPLGVTIALEPLGPDETTFMVFAEDTVKLMHAIDHPACRLHLDVKAMSQEHKPVAQVIRDNAEHMVYFHANDANLRGPGFGDTDFAPIAAALKDVGYDGTVSVEVFDYKPDPQTIARQSLDHLKDTFRAAGAI